MESLDLHKQIADLFAIRTAEKIYAEDENLKLLGFFD